MRNVSAHSVPRSDLDGFPQSDKRQPGTHKDILHPLPNTRLPDQKSHNIDDSQCAGNHRKGLVCKTTTLGGSITLLIFQMGKQRHSIKSLGQGDTAREKQDWV